MATEENNTTITPGESGESWRATNGKIPGQDEAYREQVDLRQLSKILFGWELNRLKNEFGSEHLKVAAFEKLAGDRRHFNDALDVEFELASIDPQELSPGQFRMHGRVTDKMNRGISGLTVAACDRNGKPINVLDSVMTNNSGYYAITGNDEQLPGHEPGLDIFLTVLNKQGSVLHREETSVRIEPEADLVANIVLSRVGTSPVDDVVVPTPPADPGETIVIRGRLRSVGRQSMAGLKVRLADHDRKFIDLLGTAVTDRNGKFEFSYSHASLETLIKADPDIFVIVMDRNDKLVYTSKKGKKMKILVQRPQTIKISRGSP